MASFQIMYNTSSLISRPAIRHYVISKRNASLNNQHVNSVENIDCIRVTLQMLTASLNVKLEKFLGSNIGLKSPNSFIFQSSQAEVSWIYQNNGPSPPYDEAETHFSLSEDSGMLGKGSFSP